MTAKFRLSGCLTPTISQGNSSTTSTCRWCQMKTCSTLQCTRYRKQITKSWQLWRLSTKKWQSWKTSSTTKSFTCFFKTASTLYNTASSNGRPRSQVSQAPFSIRGVRGGHRQGSRMESVSIPTKNATTTSTSLLSLVATTRSPFSTGH